MIVVHMLHIGCAREQLTKEASALWEKWCSTVAPQSDSAEEYCDPVGPTPLFIPLVSFLPQSPHFIQSHESDTIEARGRSKVSAELQRYRTGERLCTWLRMH